MKMTKLLITASLAFLLAGCKSPDAPRPAGLIVTRLQDVNPRSGFMPPPSHHFGPGETPCFYVRGYGGQTVTITIRDFSNGQREKTDTDFIPQGKDFYWWYSNLQSGLNRVDLAVNGNTVDYAVFKVSR